MILSVDAAEEAEVLHADAVVEEGALISHSVKATPGAAEEETSGDAGGETLAEEAPEAVDFGAVKIWDPGFTRMYPTIMP